jgi:hypothetical protein
MTAPGVNERQLITISGNPNSGTYLLGFRGEWGLPLRYNANDAAMTATLSALPTVGAGNLIVIKRASVPEYDVYFSDVLGQQDVPLIDVDDSGLNRGSVVVTVVTEGSAPPVPSPPPVPSTSNPLQVIVTPGGVNYDSDGNPTTTGAPIGVTALAIAPGATTFGFVEAGELDDVEFTAYFALGAPIADDDVIQVRGKLCRARVKEWRSPWTGRGGLEVLCKSATGVGPT